nr:retrovirus-related Pol polyprotein from transposon TNT 1-94 [Tanacetum cinerariifolium]
MNPQGGGAVGYRGVQNRVGNVNPGQARPAQENGVALDTEQLLFLAGGQDNAFDDDVDEQPVQDLALNVDNVFQADDCDAFDSDVDEAPMAQTMFMAILSSADPVTDEVGPSYDSDILSEVRDNDHYQDAICAHHEKHVMRDSVQLNHVVDSHADYTSDSNMIPYHHYVKDNEVPVVHSDVSSVPNDSFMMIYNDMCEPHAQFVSNPSRNTVVENSLTAELATYKEQVKLYKRQAKFELTEREQMITKQLRLVISDRNFKEETLKKELHYIKLQLASTIHHNKSMAEEAEDRLLKQDQSLQTVYMLCRPKPYYNELNKVAIGYKNPLCLTRAKKVQPALYNGHEIFKYNHAPAIVHNTEDTLEIAEITRKKMNDKMKDLECVTRKGKIAPHDYSKENFLATFTPQKQPTPEKIFWSQDLSKLKSEAVKEQTTASRPIKALTVYSPNTPATLVPRVLPMKKVFSVATNSELNVSRFTDMNVAHTIVEGRCLELEAELANLLDKSHHDNQEELINHFSKLEIKPKVLARGKHAIDVEPIIHRLRNNKDAHLDYLMHLKESVETIRDIVEEAKVVVQIILWYLDSDCSKHMTGDRSRLMNFVKKFIETVRFRNDHSVLSWVMEIMQFCDSDLKIAFRKHSCYVRETNGVELVKGSRGSNLYTISIEDMMKSSPIFPRTPQQNGVVERWNRTLVEAARTMLIFSKALMFLWAEAVATACYTQNQSLIHTRHHKTPYELVHNKKPDLTFFRVFGALCYPTNDSEELGKLQPTADIRIFVGYAPRRKGYQIYNKRTRRIMETIHVQFDELTTPMAPVHLVQALVNSAGTPSSTTIDQDAPSPSISLSSIALQSHCLHQGVAVKSTIMEDNPVPPIDNTPFINVFAPEPNSKASSSGDISLTKSTYVSQTLHYLNKWSKDHPLDNVIALKWIYKVKLDEYGDVLKTRYGWWQRDIDKRRVLTLRNNLHRLLVSRLFASSSPMPPVKTC